MLLQFEVVRQALAAVRAVVRVLARVHHAFVLPHAAKLGEALVALAALKGPLARMRTQVRLEVRLLSECLAAVGAGVHLGFPCVHLPVALHVGVNIEALAAQVALVRFLIRVYALVPLDSAGPGEALLAHVARERALARVDPLVQRDVIPVVAAVGAVRALVLALWLRPMRGLPMLVQLLGHRERFAAFLAAKHHTLGDNIVLAFFLILRSSLFPFLGGSGRLTCLGDHFLWFFCSYADLTSPGHHFLSFPWLFCSWCFDQ